jgi:1,4-dihydroxy-2-naphthoate octaprenyltransferase
LILGSGIILKRFLDYVQFPAKVACLLPFLLALLYAALTYWQIDVRDTILFFISMFSFDLSITALNNYIDSKSSGVPLQFSKTVSKRILFILWTVAGVAATLLVFYTGPIVLVCGGVCFCVGIFYTFGPAPISHMPLGEIFSGVFEGFFIPFLVVFINSPVLSLVGYSLQNWMLQMFFNIPGLFKLSVLTLPAMLGIANIMLANNICDVDADVKVNRFTLPYYIGVKNALRLFTLLYYAAFAAVVAMAVFRVLPVYVLAVLIMAVFVQKNVMTFSWHQSKTKTFPLSVQNFMLVMVPLIFVTGAALIF